MVHSQNSKRNTQIYLIQEYKIIFKKDLYIFTLTVIILWYVKFINTYVKLWRKKHEFIYT